MIPEIRLFNLLAPYDNKAKVTTTPHAYRGEADFTRGKLSFKIVALYTETFLRQGLQVDVYRTNVWKPLASFVYVPDELLPGMIDTILTHQETQ